MLRKVDVSELPFLDSSAEATDPTWLPLLQLLDNTIQKLLLRLVSWLRQRIDWFQAMG